MRTRTLFPVLGAPVRLVYDNPVITKDLREVLDTRRAAILFALFTGLLAGIIFLAWPRGEQMFEDVDRIARRLFDVVGVTLIALVSLLAPAFSATAITGEKERDCFDLLVASGVGELRILVGKLLSSLIFLGLLVFATLPLVSVCLLLGGIAPDQIVALYLLLFLLAVAFATVGLTCSCFFPRNSASLGVTYAIVLPVLGLLLVIGDASRLASLGPLIVIAFYTLTLVAITLVLLRLRIHHPPETRTVEDEENDQRMREVTGLILNRDQIPDKWLAPPRRTHLLADGKNPVLDKELRNELVGQGTLMLRMILQLGFGLMLVFTFAYMLGRPAHLFAYLASFTLLITPAFTAGLFTSEHENETFSLLATTLVTPREIVMGKVYVGLRLSLVLLALLILPTMPALVFSQLQSQIISVPALLALIATCVLWATALVAISLAWSASSRRTTAALIGSYLTGAAILVGPLLVQTVVVNFTSLPEAWANAGLTLSPLSHLYALGLPQGTRDVPTFAILGSEWTRWSLCAALLAILSVGLPLLIMARLERTWRRRAFD